MRLPWIDFELTMREIIFILSEFSSHFLTLSLNNYEINFLSRAASLLATHWSPKSESNFLHFYLRGLGLYKSYIGSLRPQPQQHGRVKQQWCQMTYTKFDTYSPLQQRPNDKKFKHENLWVKTWVQLNCVRQGRRGWQRLASEGSGEDRDKSWLVEINIAICAVSPFLARIIS